MLELQVRALTAFWAARDAAIARTDWHDERGEVTSTTIVIAVLAALSLAVGVIITQKVTQKANSIPIDGSGTPAGG
jgi:hypothetical protein